MDIVTFKKKFDPYLQKALEERAKELKKIIKDKFILDAALYPNELLLAGGKRIRPCLAYLMYKAEGGAKEKELLKLLVGLEVFHMYALVHDDIIDRSRERHAVMTAHKYITSNLKKESRGGDHGHMANGIAMLVGDLLFGWANELVTNNKDFPEKNMSKVRDHYAQMIRSVILGQMLDVDTTTRRRVDEKMVMQKIQHKTAEYTFVNPLLVGLSLGGGSGKREKFCRDFGMALGTAYQIQDDLMDLTKSSAEIKKPVLNDIRENVHTLFTWYIFEHAESKDKKELDSLMGSAVDESDDARVRDLFERTGSLAYGTKVMNKHFKKARTILKGSTLKAKDKADFEALISFIENRTL